MILPLPQICRRRFLIDIDTQRNPRLGERDSCIRNNGSVRARVRELIAWARHENISIISTTAFLSDPNPCSVSHHTDNARSNSEMSPILQYGCGVIPADNMNYLPQSILRNPKHILVQKRCADPFGEPRLDRLFSHAQADQFILIGINTEGAVEATALGLLQRGKNVHVVVDAVGSSNSQTAEYALRKMQVKGARLIGSEELL